jgi:hypothetical protein
MDTNYHQMVHSVWVCSALVSFEKQVLTLYYIYLGFIAQGNSLNPDQPANQ